MLCQGHLVRSTLNHVARGRNPPCAYDHFLRHTSDASIAVMFKLYGFGHELWRSTAGREDTIHTGTCEDLEVGPVLVGQVESLPGRLDQMDGEPLVSARTVVA